MGVGGEGGGGGIPEVLVGWSLSSVPLFNFLFQWRISVLSAFVKECGTQRKFSPLLLVRFVFHKRGKNSISVVHLFPSRKFSLIGKTPDRRKILVTSTFLSLLVSYMTQI